ncbi:berberine and berberine like domain-containing protein [Sarocladium implicatum]|nr:berberine and berberine like domain-containing protein [Sarocladium implicatum]
MQSTTGSLEENCVARRGSQCVGQERAGGGAEGGESYDWGERLRKVPVTPRPGAYLNEADIIEPDFQQAFYGGKYERLRDIKERWDPTGLFYAPTAVRSEECETMAEKIFGNIPSQNSKLCRKWAV